MSHQAFIQLLRHRSPRIAAQFYKDSDETPTVVDVKHLLGSAPSTASRKFLTSLGRSKALSSFVAFYRQHDGVELCRTYDSRFDDIRPLLDFKPAEDVRDFTAQYEPDGDFAWIIDLNKSKNLYRGSPPWIAFAEIDAGPACLTMILKGENAGHIFFATPEPPFNILRPIAKSFDGLLDRIVDDVAAFLRLIRVSVTLQGADGHNYGLVPVEYQRSAKSAG